MLEVVSIKFKNRGKSYYFAPNSLDIKTGDKVIVETAKGLEIADCARGNHMVEDTAVIQPLRPVARIATADDLRIAQLNKNREKEAFEIGKQKIAEHGLEMKLVDVECNFEGNKTTFFFTADGRVDFRELVKDLAGIFRNRIDLRQIGVRDEAKMIGGIGICGRPYCCSQFLDGFQPVSTKMAKIQSLSLNPTKISGSCGRLMCCLRYEQEAYEDLVKSVPKQGAFVETKDGYGTAVQVNLLRQTVKVRLDGDNDDTLRVFRSNELAAVPGGRPKEGEPLPSVLNYVPEEQAEEPESEKEDEWSVPLMVVPEPISVPPEEQEPDGQKKTRRRRSGRGKRKTDSAAVSSDDAGGQERGDCRTEKQSGREPGERRSEKSAQKEAPRGGRTSRQEKKPNAQSKATVKPVKVESRHAEGEKAASPEKPHRPHRRRYGKPHTKHTGGETPT